MQLTLDQAAEKHSAHEKSPLGSRLYIYKKEAFEAGAEWQKEQYKEIIPLLKGIAQWAGNLPDDKLITLTGSKDAALRGGMVTDMRSIAVDAIRKFEPDYTPFDGYTND
jgi:hypothetical protein